ncbi:MAG TPA: tetratricopeptide repeat protein [Arenicellales bacterium]|nr:tetratricopeptide repeat protein [Arenicellales bacterium]
MPTNVVEIFELSRVPRLDNRIYAVVLAVLLSAGCVLAPSQQQSESSATAAASEEAVPATASEPTEAELPDVELDAELLYKVLIGEVAANRGARDTAADSLMEAARISRDPRLAQRATRLALDAERYDLAQEAATLWVELQPDRSQPRESRALIMAEQGRVEEAAAELIELLGSGDGPGSADLRRAARLLSQLSDKESALAVMERIVSAYQDQPEAHFAEAFLADRVGRSKLVLGALDQALVLRPDWEEAALAKLGHLIQNDYPREQVAEFALGFLDQAPEANRVRISYARYLVDQQASADALEQFRQVLKTEPDNTTGLLSAGLLSIQEGEYKAARKYLKRHLELTPDNDQLRVYLGQIAEEQERYDAAEKWYRQVSDPDQIFEVGLRLGSVIYERDGVEAAIEHLDSLSPDNEDEFVRLALTKEMVLRQAEELERARAVLDDAVARYPGNTELRYSRGLLLARLDLISEHEQDMRVLLAEDPNNAHALNALGYTLADATDRFDEAYELISKALEMRPDDPFILDSMGWVQYRLGNHEDAIEYLERALSQREDAEIAAHLGEVLWVTGERERARDVWTRARRENPDNHVLNETIQRFIQ